MSNYFNQVPNFEYVSRIAGGKKLSDYIPVKNLFKRGKIKDDIFNDITYFTQYQIKGDDRPDNVAFDVYEDETLDWVILLTNNILNIQTEWPLPQEGYYNFLLDKYGSEENIHSIHHYETLEVKDSRGVVLLHKGLQVPENYSFEYLDVNLGSYTTASNITAAVTNIEYEDEIENSKRNIYVLKGKYLNMIMNDMDEIMPYKEGSTQYVSETLVRAENSRLFN